MFELMGIKRTDKAARAAAMINNFRFFGVIWQMACVQKVFADETRGGQIS